MPGAGVQILDGRVGGSKTVSRARDLLRGAAAWVRLRARVFVTRASFPVCRRVVREDGGRAPPAARPGAEGALEPV